MAARPTINDVARAAGVSKGAVSFALNGKPGVADTTRARILDTARLLGWTPSSPARALSASRAFAVGLVIARSPETLGADPFFPAFIAGVEAVLSEEGMALLLQVAPNAAREEEHYRRLVRERRVDGVFVTDLHLDDARPALLADLGLPTVLIGPGLRDTHFPCVGVDDRPGIAAAVDHLVGLGHTRIAHVGGPADLIHGHTRRTAWAAALRRAGLAPGPFVESDFSGEGGAVATARLLDLAEPPTAIVYANDLMALAGVSVAANRGVRVPAQLSVTGFDDTEMAAHMRPTLTSVSSDVLLWGQAAARRLVELVGDVPPTHTTLPEPHLVVRESTGPAPARWT